MLDTLQTIKRAAQALAGVLAALVAILTALQNYLERGDGDD